MSGAILSLNAGSSSIKFAAFSGTDGARPVEICRGQADGLGVAPKFKARAADGRTLADGTLALAGRTPHEAALAAIISVLEQEIGGAGIAVVGHRIVHGGARFVAPVAVTDEIVTALAALAPLAPLHQPHNLAGIAAARRVFPAAMQVACFDTAFHRTHDWVNDAYALPRKYYEEGIRRYGFHGLSYAYVSRELDRIAPGEAQGRVIIAHLGNGASLCAVHGGRAVATTMGFSPLDGLAMGTRTGQIDPSVVFYLARNHKLSLDAIEDLFYRQSGLRGISQLSSDMRALEAAGTPAADDAIAYFGHMVRREIGALSAILGGLDVVVFTGGIGENSVRIRSDVAGSMAWLGLTVDHERNAANGPVISVAGAPVTVRVIATNEEAFIAAAAAEIMRREGQ